LSSEKVGLLVVAGGKGVRLGTDRPKQYLSCAGRPLIVHTLEALAASFRFSAVTVVIRAEDRALYDEAVAQLTARATAALGAPAIGGATRQQSVLSGLEALVAAEPDIVRGPSRRSIWWAERLRLPSDMARRRPERR
jgi:2-C-methyl-D-erythritol 4-phosphate cytidylyltransferase/2-C-methyl-D-erythritol 2,4-cyclodiphosphate synthase